jgi:hypothetical protein
MSTQVQYRRGTETQNNAFTGALAEITVDTTNWTLRVHDGVTAGGQQVIVGTTATQALTNKSYSGTAVSVSGNVVGGNINTAGLITATGNVSGGNLISAALVQGVTVSASGNVVGGNINSAGLVSVVGNISGANLTLPSLSGNIIAHRGQFYGNIDVYGNLNATVGLVYANSGVFLGDAASGNGAAYAGVPGYTSLGSNVVMQFAGNVNSYSQLNFENINSGTEASTDYIATADNGTDSINFIDFGIGSSTYAPVAYPAYGPNDGYLLNNGGNLLINSQSAGKEIKFLVGGSANANVVANIASTGLKVTGTISASGNVTGNYILGNGALLTGVITSVANINSGTSNVTVVSSGGNITVGVAGTSNVAVFASTGEYVTGLISATGNITGGNLSAGTGTITVGGLSFNGNTITSSGSTLTIDPNSSGGNDGEVIIAGNLSVTGNVTYFNSNVVTINDKFINLANNAATAAAADGSGIGVGPIASEYATFTYNSTGNVWVISNGANVSGAVSATGNVTGGNILTSGQISATGNITGGNLITGAGSGGNLTGANVISATTFTGTTVSVTGNITGGNIIGTHVGNLTGTTVSVTGNIDGGNLRTTGLISATGAITGAAITGSSLTVSTGTITVGNIVNSNSTGVGNIGSSTVAFNTVFAKATSAQYADLAETYASDAQYAPGTVLSFGGAYEVTLTTVSEDSRIAGVVSTNPAHVMNSDLAAEYPVVIALTGRVPTSVVGTVRKGDMMVSAGNGAAQACATPAMGTVIGKALEDFDGSVGVIEVVVGRL